MLSTEDYVITRSPHRISLGGGGSDFPNYFKENSGMVLSTSINRYVYVTTSYHSRSFRERYRLHYSSVELCDTLNQIQNGIIRECLRYANNNWGLVPSLTISTTSDVPSQAGLGSSSAFCVALLLNLSSRFGVVLSKTELAFLACKIEIEILKKPIGYQDQFACALGGFNAISFNRDSTVEVEKVPSSLFNEVLDGRLYIVSSGIFRSADEILINQFRPDENQKVLIAAMVRNTCELVKGISQSSNQGDLLTLISNSIRYQKDLKFQISKAIAPSFLLNKIEMLEKISPCVVKVNGAGGGGFMTVLLEDPDTGNNYIEQVMNETGMFAELVHPEEFGASILVHQFSATKSKT